MKKGILLLILDLFAFLLLQAQPFTAVSPEQGGYSDTRLERIDQLIETAIEAEAIPGAVTLIVRNGQIVQFQAYGYSDVENKERMEKDDIFRIASQSKALTSLAVMMLWEEGKFQLDDPISKYIPEFSKPHVITSFDPVDSSYTAQPAKREITVRHLLTHTSGIDYAGIGSTEFKAIYAKAGIPSGIGNDNFILGERMKILGKLPLKHEPGERFTYSLSIDLLGYLVEIWSGMYFDEFLSEKIFKPLGMNDTYFYLPPSKHDRLVPLYSGAGGKLTKMSGRVFDGVDPDYPTLEGSYFSGGAGLSSTIEDYAKFLQLFLNQGTLNGNRLLSRKTVELMLTNQIQIENTAPFGLGFGLETAANDYLSPESIGTFRWGGAFKTTYWADPAEGLIALLYTNMYQQTKFNDLSSKFKVMVYQAIND